MKVMGVAAAAVAMGLCAPASAQNYAQCSGDARAIRAKEISERCTSLSGQPRQNCVARIDGAYQNAMQRCEAAEQQRLDRLAAQAAQAKANAEQKVLDAARRAGAPRR